MECKAEAGGVKRVMRGILMTGNWIISLTQERGKQI